MGAVAKIGLKEDKQESSSDEGSSDDESDYDVSATFIFYLEFHFIVRLIIAFSFGFLMKCHGGTEALY